MNNRVEVVRPGWKDHGFFEIINDTPRLGGALI
jgi:hypothetical protein